MLNYAEPSKYNGFAEKSLNQPRQGLDLFARLS